jgi:hypothetical protein
LKKSKKKTTMSSIATAAELIAFFKDATGLRRDSIGDVLLQQNCDTTSIRSSTGRLFWFNSKEYVYFSGVGFVRSNISGGPGRFAEIAAPYIRDDTLTIEINREYGDIVEKTIVETIVFVRQNPCSVLEKSVDDYLANPLVASSFPAVSALVKALKDSLLAAKLSH